MIYATISLSLVLSANYILPRGYTPGHIWAYAWAFAWGCLAILGAGYLIDMGTVAFVAMCNFSFIFAAYIASPERAPRPMEKVASSRWEHLEVTSRTRSVTCVACLLLGFVALHFGLKEIGKPGLISIFSGTFADFATAVRDNKASLSDGGVWVTPAEISAALLFLTCAAVLAGFESALMRQGRWRLGAALAVSLSALAFVTTAGTGVRGHLLVTILLFSATYIATKIFVLGGAYRISRRSYFIGFGTIIAFLIWVVVVQSARLGDFSFEQIGATLDYLRPWFAGYIPALSVWSSDADLYGGIHQGGIPGVNLVGGVLGPLGIIHGEGVSELIAPVAIGDGSTTNAMTIFRPLLIDFGYPGTLAVCVAAGFLCQRTYMLVKGGSVGAIVPLAAIYAAILYSFNFWLFARGSRIAGVILALAVVVVSVRRQSTTRRQLGEISKPRGVSPDFRG